MNRSTESDEALLERFQCGAFAYFLENCNATNGLVADTSRTGSPCSIAVVGFALSSYPVAVERGWMPRAAAAERTLSTLRFFWASEQSEAADATGFKGFYYHFLDMQSGRRAWQSELSLIDSTLWLAGVLSASVYFDADTRAEVEIRELAAALYRRIDWQWALGGATTVRQGWKPDSGFFHYGWEGYSEGALLYILGLASPTHPLEPASYGAWTATYQWEKSTTASFSTRVRYSSISSPTPGSTSRVFRTSSCARRAVITSRTAAARPTCSASSRSAIPTTTGATGPTAGVLSANDGPGTKTLTLDHRERRFYGYAARGVPYGPDDGTLAPCAALASLPFAPALVLPLLRACVRAIRASLSPRGCRADSIRLCRAMALRAGCPKDISDLIRASSFS